MPGASRPIVTLKIFDGVAIAKNEAATSQPIDLRELANNWKFSLHAIIAGTGQVDISVLTCSTKDGTYVADSTLIADDQAAGTIMAAVDPVLAPYIKIKFTENNTNPITALDVWLNIF